MGEHFEEWAPITDVKSRPAVMARVMANGSYPGWANAQEVLHAAADEITRLLTQVASLTAQVEAARKEIPNIGAAKAEAWREAADLIRARGESYNYSPDIRGDMLNTLAGHLRSECFACAAAIRALADEES